MNERGGFRAAAAAAYKIQRRLRPDGPWSDVRLAVESEITLTNQERGKEWEYRVFAVNKAGEGEPSNTVMAVLTISGLRPRTNRWQMCQAHLHKIAWSMIWSSPLR